MMSLYKTRRWPQTSSSRIRVPPHVATARSLVVQEEGEVQIWFLKRTAQTHALTIPVDPNVFLPYQRRVIEAIRQIEQLRPSDLPAAQASDLRRVIHSCL